MQMLQNNGDTDREPFEQESLVEGQVQECDYYSAGTGNCIFLTSNVKGKVGRER